MRAVTTTLGESHRFYADLYRRSICPRSRLSRRIRLLFLLLLIVQAELLASHFGVSHVAPMAVVLVEGFDNVGTSLLTAKGWTVNPAAVTTGRFGVGQAATFSAASDKALPSTYTTLIAGCAANFVSTTASSNQQFLRFLTTGGAVVAAIRCNTAGRLEVINSAATVIATGTTVLAAGNWNYIELKIVVNGAAGSCEVHLNGAAEIAATTGNFGSTAIGTLELRDIGSTGCTFDDVYACDTTGSAPRNTFLGDVRIGLFKPSGAGAHTAWAANGAASNYLCVNEVTPDGDTTYISDSTPGDIDTYAFEDIDAAATIFAVQSNHYARKDDAATRQTAPVIRQGGTDYVGTTVTLATGYGFFTQIYNQDPAGADWTPSNFNADEFGVKQIA